MKYLSLIILFLSASAFCLEEDSGSLSMTEYFLKIEGIANPCALRDYDELEMLEGQSSTEKEHDQQGWFTLYHGQASDGLATYELVRLLEGGRERTNYFRSSAPGISDISNDETALTFVNSEHFKRFKVEGILFPYSDMRPYVRNRVISCSLTLADNSGSESSASFMKKAKGVLSDSSFGYTGYGARQNFDRILSDLIGSYSQQYDNSFSVDEVIELFLSALNTIQKVASSQGKLISRQMTIKIRKEIVPKVMYLATANAAEIYADEDQLALIRHVVTSAQLEGPIANSNQSIEVLKNFGIQNPSLDQRYIVESLGKNPQARLMVSHPLLSDPENFQMHEQLYPVDGIEGVAGGFYSVRDFLDQALAPLADYLTVHRK